MGWASTISICASLSASQREADPGAGTGPLVEQGSFRFGPPIAGSGGRALWKQAWGLEQQGATRASKSRFSRIWESVRERRKVLCSILLSPFLRVFASL